MKILFVDILTDDPKLHRFIEKTTYDKRPYAERFRTILRLKKDEFIVVDATKERLPNPKIFDAIIIGGSAENPTDPRLDKPWMKKTFAFIRRVERSKIPLLGICGGLQFTARALGGCVIFNPRGRRIGTQKVQLTKEGTKDFLFQGVPRSFRIAATHCCIVQSLKKYWRLLAESDLSPYDAIAIGDNIRLVQFHPEMSLQNIKRLLKQKKEQLRQEKIPTPSLALPDRAGKKILKNFLCMAAKQKQKR